jgi:rubredoxin
MIVYRCTQCTHDNVNLNPPQGGMGDPKCERCGGTSFAQIHLPDVIDTDFVDAPPLTPRDMPQREGESVGETMEVAALRPDPDKEAHQCGQHNCYETATHRFTWPGHPESRACYPHAQKAMRLAEAMGFFLECPAL